MLSLTPCAIRCFLKSGHIFILFTLRDISMTEGETVNKVTGIFSPSANRLHIPHLLSFCFQGQINVNEVIFYKSAQHFIACCLLGEILRDSVITRFCSTLPTSMPTTKCTQRPWTVTRSLWRTRCSVMQVRRPLSFIFFPDVLKPWLSSRILTLYRL